MKDEPPVAEATGSYRAVFSSIGSFVLTLLKFRTAPSSTNETAPRTDTTAGDEKPPTDTTGGEKLLVDNTGGEKPPTDTAGTEKLLADTTGNERLLPDPIGGEKLLADTTGDEKPLTDTAGGKKPPETEISPPVKAPKLKWTDVPELVANAKAGYMLWPGKVDGWVENPEKLALVFEPSAGVLPLGKNTLTVRAEPRQGYAESVFATDVSVVRSFAWPDEQGAQRPTVSKYADDSEGFRADRRFLSAVTMPADKPIKYYHDGGQRLDFAEILPEGNWKIVAKLDGDDQQIIKTLKVSFTKEQQKLRKELEELENELKRKAEAEAKQAKKPAPLQIDEITKKERDKLYEEQISSPPRVNPNSEYPYGAANTVPHIHKYGDDFHIKVFSRETMKISRINLVQNGKLYKNGLKDAEAYAREYDKTALYDKTPPTVLLLPIVKSLVAGYPTDG